MPKIHRMKEWRDGEGDTMRRREGGKGKIETKNLYLSKKKTGGNQDV